MIYKLKYAKSESNFDSNFEHPTLQGVLLIAIIPRAMPWARSFWAFSPTLLPLSGLMTHPFSFLLYYFPILYIEYRMISLHVLENLIQMITVRIRNKDLSEMVTGNQFHNSLNPLCIQLIENII